jgi:hypothetical protein
MPDAATDLAFRIEGAATVPYAASPAIAFAVRATSAEPSATVQSALLRCQIHVEASTRAYSDAELDRLRDVLGEARVRGRASGRILWAQTTAVVPGFAGEVVFDVHAPCTFDLAVASSRYFHALDGADVPVAMLFSGTVFHADPDGALRAAPVPWSSEARFSMPTRVWKECVEHHYAGRAALPLSRDVFDRLQRYKARAGLATWEQAIDRLLPPEEGGPR